MTPANQQLIQAVRTVLRISRILQQVCEEHHSTVQQYRSLTWIRSQTRTRPYSIAEQASISRPAVVSLVSKLEKRGLIKRETVTQDGRGIYISLEPQAFQLIADLEEGMINRLRNVFGEDVNMLSTLASSSVLKDALDEQIRKENQIPMTND